MRCRCCNRKLLDGELLQKNDITGEYDDICSICRPKCYEKFNYSEDHEYQFENLEGGITSPNLYLE